MARLFLSLAITVLMSSICSVASETLIVTLKNSSLTEKFVKEGASPVFPAATLSRKVLPDVMSVEAVTAADLLTRHVLIECSSNIQDKIYELLHSPGVESVRVVHKYHIEVEATTNDSLSDKQYGLQVVQAKKAWTLATGRGAVVGILDTGFDWDHPDLVAQVRVNPLEDANKNGTFEAWPSTIQRGGMFGDLDGVDDDGNGFVDDVIGYDFVDQSVRNIGDDQTRDPIPFDEQGHGTSVAGVIAATANNSIGIAGLAYNAKIVALRAFDATGNGEEDDIAAALVYAALNGVKIVNMSFGDGVDSPVLRDAIEFARQMGCILVASAGNTGVVSRQFPAGYDGVLVVASTNENDLRSPFSSTGSLVDISAPGERIVTTAINSRYRTVSGTSFSAPLAAACAALMLERFPAANASEIVSTLTENTNDLGTVGWDPEFGNGRLDVFAAVSSTALSDVNISHPHNEQKFDVQMQGRIEIVGTTISPLTAGYALYWGRGAEPQIWNKFAEGDSKYKSTLGVLNAQTFVTGDYVIRLIVSRRDSRTIEERKRIFISNQDTLSFIEAKIESAWMDDMKGAVLTVETSRPTYCSVLVTTKNGTEVVTTDIKRFTRLHSFPIDGYAFGEKSSAVVKCVSGSSDTITKTIQFEVEALASPLNSMSVVQSSSLAGYVLNNVSDFYGDGKPTFVMNDVSSGSFGALVTKQKSALGFTTKDSLNSVWIPRGIGDADGNGRTEIFGHVVGSAVLFESSTKNGNPFQAIRFADTSGKLNAAAMADVDGDGREDLVMLSDSGCVVYTWRNNKFVHLGTAYNTSTPSPGNFANRVDEISVGVGDLDNDGKIEVVFSDTDGDVLIYEFNGSEFVPEMVQENPGAGGSGYVAVGDIDGDGVPDVVVGIPDSVQARPDGEYGRQMWTYRFYRSTGADKYEEFWTERIYGLRYGIGYRNGVEVGQLDMRGGNEVVICAYPRLFVFSWDKTSSSLRPSWYKPEVVSPRFLIYDFNGNGINELGFGTTSSELGFMTGFAFAETDTTTPLLSAPVGVRAEIITDTSARISWFAVDGANEYDLQRATPSSPIFRTFATVSTTEFVSDSLLTNVLYRYRVVAKQNSPLVLSSKPSSSVEVFNGKRISAVAILDKSEASISNSNSVQLHVGYNGFVNIGGAEPASFVLLTASDSLLAFGQSVVAATDTSLVVGFRLSGAYHGPATLICGSIPDANYVPTIANRLTLEILETFDTRVVFIQQFSLVGTTSARLTFSTAMKAAGLTNTSNYTLEPSGGIEMVELADDSTVVVHFSTNPPIAALGFTYALSVRNVESAASIPITTGAGNTVQFVLSANNAENVMVYPHPVILSNLTTATFANLPSNATVEILDQRFKVLRTLQESDGNGGAEWDLQIDNGEQLVPGMYFFRVNGQTTTGANVSSGLKKFWVKR